eukprot:augustus_masked-scaffold_16-processed-gene-4.4-mRNA-1 protein AED:1.00 eAED:1.00 QI:0/-1/0/0/-1/1/1/0/367
MSQKKSSCLFNFCLALVLFVLILAVIGAVSTGAADDLFGTGEENGSTGSGGAGDSENCSLVELNTPVSVNEGDFISLVYTACPSSTAFQAFNNAATKISNIVTNPHSGLTLDEDLPYDEFCTFIEADGFLPSGTLLDSLVLFIEPVPIDGENGVLAAAGPCALVSGFPILGGMRFDTADIDRLEEDGTLEFVILHEMLHTVGVGTLWGSLLVDPVYTTSNGVTTGDPTANPRFVGANARTEYGVLLGGSAQDVPVEDDGNGQFDVTANEGLGSIDGHFRKDTFDDELMTFSINSADPEHPLSKMTILSLQDLGYTVDVNEADSYSLPALNKGSSLRGSDAGIVDLTGDVFIPKLEDLQRFKDFVRST